MKRHASPCGRAVALLAALVVSPDAARDAAAQIVPATASAIAGDAEGPMGNDSREGQFGAVAFTTWTDDDFGTANARSLVAGPDLVFKGSATSFGEPGWTAQGGGFWYDTPEIRVDAALVGPTDVLAVRFDLAVGWSIGSNGNFALSVSGLASEWSTAFGVGFNTLNLALGANGQQTLALELPLENRHTVTEGGHTFVVGQFTLDMSLGAGAGSGSHTHGTFGSASAKVSMRASGFEIVKSAEGGGSSELVEGTITSETDVAYSSLPFANADFDLDGDVDGNDFLVWQANYPTASGAMRSEGNANVGADGATDALDLEAWKAQFGSAVAFDPDPDPVTAAPEPSASALMLLASLFPRRPSHRRRAL
jgi:hypothetical protein